jgi:hypothetical protein
MVESMCGKGALRAVESEVRSRVKYEVRTENERKERGKEVMGEYAEEAQNSSWTCANC